MAAAELSGSHPPRDFRRKSVGGGSDGSWIWQKSLRDAGVPRPRKGKQLSPSPDPTPTPATVKTESPRSPRRRRRGPHTNNAQPVPELTPEAQVALLLEKAQLLKMERKAILDQVAQITIVPQPRHIPKTILITFVNAIEIAHQYFELKEYLRDNLDIIKHDTTLDDTLNALVESHEMENRFYRLDSQLVRHIINTRIKELKDEEKAHMRHQLFTYMKEHLTTDYNKMPLEVMEELKHLEDVFPYLTHSDFVKAIKIYMCYLLPGDEGVKKSAYCEQYVKEMEHKFYMDLYRLYEQQKEDHALLFPPYNLVLEAREKACVMDQNAEVELEKMLKSRGWYCLRYFYYRPEDFLLKMQGKVGPVDNSYCNPRTVKVSNVSLDVSEQDIKEFFTFNGDVEYVEMQSGDDQSQVAYVTFGYSEDADNAVALSGHLFEGLTVGDLPVIITSVPDYQLPVSPSAPMFQAKRVNAARGAKSTAELPKDVWSSLLAKALEKYSELNTYYSQLPLKDGSNSMLYKAVKKYPALNSYLSCVKRRAKAGT